MNVNKRTRDINSLYSHLLNAEANFFRELRVFHGLGGAVFLEKD